MECQEDRVKVLVRAAGWEEVLAALVEEEWEVKKLEAREVIASAPIVEKKLSISRVSPVTQSTAPNAVQKW
ncbi:MAG: hypothetical protein AMK74_01425 [Nitrospira bacterium SM23_35]|nr:MAG: hypothetical protein AMK74_01425 [Nitrospira bacterium SM23_35]